MATTDTDVSQLVINKLTKAQYDDITTPSNTELYFVDDGKTYATTDMLATVATSGSYTDLTNKPTIPTVDAALSSTSTNPVQNKVIYDAIGNVESILQTLNNGNGAS